MKTLTVLVGEWNNRIALLQHLVREYTRYSWVVELVNIQSYKYHNAVLELGLVSSSTAIICRVSSRSFRGNWGGS